MPHTISYNQQDHILESEVFGEITAQGVVQLFGDMIVVAKEKNCFLWLHDFNKAQRRIDFSEIYYLPRQMDDIADAHGVSKRKIKRAIVTTKDLRDFEFAELVASNIGQRLKIFLTAEAARAWLKDGDAQ